MLILPERWPDESIYSLLAKIVRINGLAHLGGTGILVGEEHPPSVIGCPVNLKRFSEITRGIYGSPGDILRNTTLFQLLAHLGELNDSTLSQIENGVRRPELGLLAFGVKKVYQWRFCRECAARDKNAYGISYWHRAHQLPYSHYCPEHELLLDRVDIPRVNLLDRLVLPADVAELPSLTLQGINETNNAALNVSILACDALADNSEPFHQATILATYKAGLAQSGLLKRTAGMRLAEYSDEFRRRFGEEASLTFGLSRPKVSNPRQILFGILDDLVPRPFARLLLTRFLFGAWDAFKEQCRWQDTLAPRVNESFNSQVKCLSSEALLRKHRQACLDYKASRIFPTRYEFMRVSYRAFRWLRHNDREWLNDELPIKQRAKGQRRLFDD